MNPFFNLLLLFLFVIAVFYFVIDVSNQRFLMDKLIIFVAMFFFQFVLMLISKVINKCKININELVNECLRVALVSVIGYSVYTDLTIMDSTKDTFEFDPINPHKSKWAASIIIIVLLTFVKTIQLLLEGEQYNCSD